MKKNPLLKKPEKSVPEKTAFVRAEKNGKNLSLFLSGRLDSATTGNIWQKAISEFENANPDHLILELSGLNYCDVSGIALLVELRRRQLQIGKKIEIQGLREKFQELLNLFDPAEMKSVQQKPKHENFFESTGRAATAFFKESRELISFIGELCAAFVATLLNPQKMRWRDTFIVAERTGVNALPIVAMIGFLIGLIMAFQAAIPMRQFGAEIYVANLIALSMLRELGPLMTAIILAGRSGSAFAAEIGTMKVNEEIDALTTMGIDPISFLVVGRVIASVIMTPMLTIFADLISVLGGSIVLLSLGYPFITYYNQVLASVTYIDFLTGLFKSVIFGLLVAAIGCLRGLQTKNDATAVGDAATRSVVSGIMLIIVTDGIFSVIFYYLGI